MGTPNALCNLQFVDAVGPRSMPAVQQRRNKLSNKLWEQIQLAKSQLEHTHFVVKRRVTVKDLEGNFKSIERPKRIKPWWFMASDGTLCVSVFYGSKRIQLIPGKTTKYPPQGPMKTKYSRPKKEKEPRRAPRMSGPINSPLSTPECFSSRQSAN